MNQASAWLAKVLGVDRSQPSGPAAKPALGIRPAPQVSGTGDAF